MQDTVKVEHAYRDDSTQDDRPKRFTKEMIDSCCLRIKQGKSFYYGSTDTCLFRALKKHSISGKTVAIIGSEYPLYESICILCGGFPTTIEYKKIISEDDRVAAITVDEYEKKPFPFDAAVSISSLEHDGLGRYGDPVNPDGDLQTMTRMKSLIKKDGLLFLSVPVGRDKLVWNLHRVYGKIRLPKLLDGWKILDIYHYWYTWQPVFVLQNSDAGKPDLDRFLGLMEITSPAREAIDAAFVLYFKVTNKLKRKIDWYCRRHNRSNADV